MKCAISDEVIEQIILFIRGQKVMLDADLARLYGVKTRQLVQAIKRNQKRFPSDFMFRLTRVEDQRLRSQFVISKKRGGRRYLPYVFTEHGAVMAANILNSERAVQMSVFVVRAFIRLRQYLSNNKTLAYKLTELEQKLTGRLDDHEKVILHIISEIKKLMSPSKPPKRKIGFHP